MDYKILVNKENRLEPNFVPESLITTDENENNFHKFQDPMQKPTIHTMVLPYFLKMQQDAKKAGFNIIVDSGYRSYEYQQVVWNYFLEEIGLEETKKRVALPGTSEHQTGLAIDVGYIINGKFIDEVEEAQLETQWLFQNAYKYGFILRYPKGKEEITGYNYEPWHYRFVGLELAKKLFDENITLEEYYTKIKDRHR